MKEEFPYIMTPIERHENKVDVQGVLIVEEIDFTQKYKIGMFGYPGIYMGITHKTLEELKEENKDECLIIFHLS